MAIDRDLQMRVVFIIAENTPDTVIKADITNHDLQAAYSIPQIRTEISLSKSCHNRERRMKTWIKEDQGTER